MDVAAASYILIDYILREREQKPRRYWQRQLYSRRNNYGVNILADLKLSGLYKNFSRMSPCDFELLVTLIGPKIFRQDTSCRRAISVQERLAVTLRFLATGDSYTSLQYLFKISKQSISTIIPEVCQAIVDSLKHNVQIPTSAQEWLVVEKNFREVWNLPHCLGALDGKHVVIQKPMNSGSEYFNYKSSSSIVLFALVDADYNFLYANVGGQGRISDGGIFKSSVLYEKIQKNELNFPKPKPLEGREKKIPYFFVGDEAFALCETLMKPFSGVHPSGSQQRSFNYRLSRARRVVENVFGIISSIFRLLRKPMLLEPEKSEVIVMSIVYLHNFLRKSNSSRSVYNPNDFVSDDNGESSEGTTVKTSLLPLKNIPRRSPVNAQEIRNELSDYFQNEGRLPWQDDYA